MMEAVEALSKWAMGFGELCTEASLRLEDKYLTAIEYENIQGELMAGMKNLKNLSRQDAKSAKGKE